MPTLLPECGLHSPTDGRLLLLPPYPQRLSIAQQCIDRWNGFDIEYFKKYALPFLPASSAASSAGSAASSAGSAASSAAASTRPMDALTRGIRMLTIDATHVSLVDGRAAAATAVVGRMVVAGVQASRPCGWPARGVHAAICTCMLHT